MCDTRSTPIYVCDRQHDKASASAPGVRFNYSKVYAVASTARSKLRREADALEHNLRRLVGHANLLDAALEDLRILTPRVENEKGQAEILDEDRTEIEDYSDVESISDDDEFTGSEGSEADNGELDLVRWPSQLLCAPKPGPTHLTHSNRRPSEVPSSQPIHQHAIAALLDRLEEDLSGESSDEDGVPPDELRPWNIPSPGNGSLTLAMIPTASDADFFHTPEIPAAQTRLVVPAA